MKTDNTTEINKTGSDKAETEEEISYRRSIVFIIEFLFKVFLWGTIALLVIKDLSNDDIFLIGFDALVGLLLLSWFFSIIYPNEVIKFCLSDKEKVSSVYSSLFILFFSIDSLIQLLINSTKEYSVSFGFNFFVTIMTITSLVLIFIYPKGTIFYHLFNKFFDNNSSRFLDSKDLSPLSRRAFTSIMVFLLDIVYLFTLFFFSKFA